MKNSNGGTGMPNQNRTGADAFVNTMKDIETRAKAALKESDRELDRATAKHEAACLADFYAVLKARRLPAAVCREMLKEYAEWRMSSAAEETDSSEPEAV